MKEVTLKNIDSFIKQYEKARDGQLNEETTSEAMFIAIGKYCGVFILSTGTGIFWIGIQNASSRMTDGGKSFSSVQKAIGQALQNKHPTGKVMRVFYSDDFIKRSKWITKQIKNLKKQGDFLLWAEQP